MHHPNCLASFQTQRHAVWYQRLNYHFDLKDPQETVIFAQTLAAKLLPGDALLLSGPVGAGKSLLARAIIKYLCGAETDVPSPSFTLVQSYSSPVGEIWHVDLFRLQGGQDIANLGLDDALSNTISLIEWPELLEHHTPLKSISIDLQPDSVDERLRKAKINTAGNWPWLPALMESFGA